MKLGTENKKVVYWLAALGVLAVISIYVNFFSDSTSSGGAKPAATERERIAAEATGSESAAVPAARASSQPSSQPSAPPHQFGSASRGHGDEFHPSLRSKRKEEQIDPLTVDPTLHLDLLAKVQTVKLDGGQRNLFQFGEAARLEGDERKIVPTRAAMGPPTPAPPAPPPPPPPPPPMPPITLKYYGLATKRIDNKKTGFFLDGEDIILATEGMMVKKRYKVKRISAESAVLEDQEFKREQSLKIAEDAGGTM